MSDTDDLFDDPEISALAKEVAEGEPELTAPIAFAPTPASVAFAQELLEKAGYSEDEYDFKIMSQKEVSELIDSLKDELGYD